MEYIKLNTGIMMPKLGLGTYKSTDPEECENAVLEALRIGYRLIDTAQIYGNEAFIGKALKRTDVPREDLFIVTKVWFRNFGKAYESVIRSMKDLGVDYLDLVLLHWPFGDTYAAWRDLEKLFREGLVRNIGVSNYEPDRLVDLIMYNEVVPAVNQIETNLVAQRKESHKWMEKYGVAHMGYAPFCQGRMDQIFDDPALTALAAKYGKTARQVTLRFLIQSDVIQIPKSVHAERLKENFNVLDFTLSEEDMALLAGLDRESPLIGRPEDPEKVERASKW
ncbi:MAG: aldo/keto reductase [Bacteroidales bacterium]|nr:aldo/keto reductase [Bacteroidales bacterium]